jgi:thiol-disulfide isomerase/thioredoxin
METRLMTPEFLAGKFSQGLPYDQYLLTGNPEQQRRWTEFHARVTLTAAHRDLLAGFVRQMHVLVVSGIWCGDCVQQCPLLDHIASANPAKIDLRFVDRDLHRDLAEQVRINEGDRVPVALFLAEDFHLCSIFGDRTLNRYRAMAHRQLGPSCPTGIGGPDGEELAATLNDWVNEFERIQLMLRLSPRLRKKHADSHYSAASLLPEEK